MIDQKWMDTCINAGEMLYGEFPLGVFHKLYETRCSRVSDEEVMEHYDESLMMLCDGEMFTPLMAREGEMLEMFREADKNGIPYASLHFDLEELQDLRREQSQRDLDYWIPEASQIQELVENGYIRTPQFTELEKVVQSHKGDASVLPSLWAEISTGKLDTMEIFQKIFDTTGMKLEGDLDDINKNVMGPMMEFVNGVNHRNRKGWAPHDLFNKQHPHGLTSMPTIVPGSAHAAQMMKQAEPQLREMGARVDYSSIDSFATVGPYGERRVIKVGRNDPCPCGSGKKYKQCHGKIK